jgi:hypothetical protein
MSYSFGWWDYIAGHEPAMINRYSEERIIRRGALTPGFAPADEPWFRFDYVADDLTYPLAVRWAPERGEIILDHNKSAEIWRRETGAGPAPPPFGTFVRVDDLVPDALWCWPGVIDAHFSRLKEDEPPTPPTPGYRFHKGRSPLTLFRLGGYHNGDWRDRWVAEEANDVHFSPLLTSGSRTIWTGDFYAERSVISMTDADDFRRPYAEVPPYERRVLLAPAAPAPSTLRFVNPATCPGFDDDYPDWIRAFLAKDPWPRRTDNLTVYEPMTPHVVSLDHKRLIRHPWTYTAPGHGSLVELALRLDFMGLSVTATNVVPGRANLLGPYMGGPHLDKTSLVCGLDGLVPSWTPPPGGVVRLADYNDWLNGQTIYEGHLGPERGADVSLQQRDLIDALFLLFGADTFLMRAGHVSRWPATEQFDCVASSNRFLGGRLVMSRIKFNYVAKT